MVWVKISMLSLSARGQNPVFRTLLLLAYIQRYLLTNRHAGSRRV